jgi:hypothetical protein
MNIVGGGISMPHTGGQVFGGPMPSADPSAITDARLTKIAELQAENSELTAKYKASGDYAVQLGQKLSETQIALAQAKNEIETLKAQLVAKK